MPERPELVLPDYNAGKSTAEVATEKKEEAQRVAAQQAWLKTFLEELKYDESVVAPEDGPLIRAH
jgi:hypothetical protein